MLFTRYCNSISENLNTIESHIKYRNRIALIRMLVQYHCKVMLRRRLKYQHSTMRYLCNKVLEQDMKILVCCIARYLNNLLKYLSIKLTHKITVTAQTRVKYSRVLVQYGCTVFCQRVRCAYIVQG